MVPQDRSKLETEYPDCEELGQWDRYREMETEYYPDCEELGQWD